MTQPIRALTALISIVVIAGKGISGDTLFPELQRPMPMSEVISRQDDGPFDFEYREEILKAADRYLAPRGFETKGVTILAWSLSYSISTVPPHSLEVLLLLVEAANNDQGLLVLHRSHFGAIGWTANYESFDEVFLRLANQASPVAIRDFAASRGFWPSTDPDFEVVKILICSPIAQSLRDVPGKERATKADAQKDDRQ